MIIGTGIDLVEIERFSTSMNRGGEPFLNKLFTTSEIAYCQKGQGDILCFAARFAAKEATLKALGTGWSQGISWHDVEIYHNKNNAPQISLTGKAELIAKSKGIRQIHLSITHTERLAAATAIAESK